jgi:hypothetical protein
MLSNAARDLWAAPAALPDDWGWLGRIDWSGQNFTAQGQTFDLTPGAEAAEPPLGIGGYLLWALAIVIALLVGLPMLFLLCVFVLALWFHLTAKLRGVNAPPVAPPLPPLSEALREDLAGAVSPSAGREQNGKEN